MKNTTTALKKLEIYSPVIDSIDPLKYHKEPPEEFVLTTNYNHFPVCINVDGSVWVHGTLYLVSKLSGVKIPNHQYLASIAQDLIAFKNWCDTEENINYQKFPKRKIFRPTYAYYFHLLELIKNQNIAVNTAKRRMSSVIAFYRWYSNQHDSKFDKSFMMQDIELSIAYKDHAGFTQTKKVLSANISIKKPPEPTIELDVIQDGGKLKPLNKNKQEILIKGLFATNNTEMIISFLIAITSGARMQTIFTIKKKHILPDINDDQELLIRAGMGTGINTKNDKKLTIFIPHWLQQRLKIYCKSPRWIERNLKSIGAYKDDDNYLFLTNRGRPYYMAKEDPNMKDYKYPPKGEAIWDFISKKLSNTIHSQGNHIKFRFHDLRATYGLNLLNERLKTSPGKKSNLMNVLNHVKQRLGHTNISTTERYLQYRENNALATKVQSEFEEYLISLMGDLEV